MEAGCSAGAEDERTVEAGPLLCLMTDEDGSSIAPVHVTCKVAIGNAQASQEGIDTSVTNILSADVLHDVCPDFASAEVQASSARFSSEVKDGLTDAYARSGIGWTVGSVECALAD
jgi:hypothetical protein